MDVFIIGCISIVIILQIITLAEIKFLKRELRDLQMEVDVEYVAGILMNIQSSLDKLRKRDRKRRSKKTSIETPASSISSVPAVALESKPFEVTPELVTSITSAVFNLINKPKTEDKEHVITTPSKPHDESEYLMNTLELLKSDDSTDY